MIRINLLPVREARRRADLQQQGFLLVALLMVAVVGTGWMHFAMRSKVSAATGRVAQINAQIKQFEPQLKQVEAYKQKKAEVQAKLDVIDGLERSRSGPVHMMDELAIHIPERMWLISLKARAGSVKIEGKSLDNEIVAAFLTELSRSPYFGNVELRSTELESRGGLKLHRFEVTTTMEDPHKPQDEAETAKATGGGAAGR